VPSANGILYIAAQTVQTVQNNIGPLLLFTRKQTILKAIAVLTIFNTKGKSKAVPLQAWRGPEVSRKLRFPDFMTTAQDGGKIVSLRRLYPQELILVLIAVTG